MAPAQEPHTADYWRKRAAEAREMIGDMKDAYSREVMLTIAEQYDNLAAEAEWRARGFDRSPRPK